MDKKSGKSIGERIKAIKHKEIIIAVIAVIAMLAIYFSSYFGGGKSGEASSSAADDYCGKIGTEVKNAVVKMSGDKDAEVIIGWESGVESVIAYSTNENQNSSSKTPTIVGSGQPLVLKEVYPKPLGVIVVIKGGNETKLKLDIISMVSTLLSISPEKVAVYGSK